MGVQEAKATKEKAWAVYYKVVRPAIQEVLDEVEDKRARGDIEAGAAYHILQVQLQLVLGRLGPRP